MNSTREDPCERHSLNLGMRRANVSSTFPWSSDPSWPEIARRCLERGAACAGASAVRAGAVGDGSDPPQAAIEREHATNVNRARRAGWICFSLPEDVLGDDEALNFTRSLINLRDASVSVVTLDAKLRRITIASMNLDRLVGDARTRFRRKKFGLGAFHGMSDVLVFARCGSQGEEARRVELGRHVGEHELDGL